MPDSENAKIADNDLPEGYRWATAEETEDWENVPGIISIPRTQDAEGNAYTQGESDLAVPVGVVTSSTKEAPKKKAAPKKAAPKKKAAAKKTSKKDETTKVADALLGSSSPEAIVSQVAANLEAARATAQAAGIDLINGKARVTLYLEVDEPGDPLMAVSMATQQFIQNGARNFAWLVTDLETDDTFVVRDGRVESLDELS